MPHYPRHILQSTLHRRLLLRVLLTGTVLPPLSAFAGFNFFLSEYTASRSELQAQIARRFPVRQRYAELFTVDLRDPQLGLDANANRAAITAQATSSASSTRWWASR